MNKATSSNNQEQDDKQAITLNFEPENIPWISLFSSWLSKHYLSLSLLLILSLALYFVFIKLPGTIQISTEVDSKSFIREEIKKPIEVSPWQETQLAKYRKEAQTILSQVLEKQQLLEDKQVRKWADTEFNLAIEQAESGDVFYRNQEFETALQTYQLTLQQLLIIESTIGSQFERQFELGSQALNNHQGIEATHHFTLALYLKPEHREAQQALERSQVLDQVTKLVKSGVVLINQQQLDQAKKEFSQAYKLDKQSGSVKQHLSEVNRAISERNYSLAMSKGYVSLNKQDYKQAIAAFKKAQKIKPKAQDPQKAIVESQNKNTQTLIAKKITEAGKNEQQENWLAAQALYLEVLMLDDSLVLARIGELRSGARLKLDQAIVNITDKPNRLTHGTVFAQAQGVYSEAKRIKQPGGRLSQQIDQMSTLFNQLAIPVSLKIESDNQTKIRLMRVGSLGNFTSKQLTLKPGEYILTGSRDGYRDVRREVKLMPNSQGNTVIIFCREKVSNG